jgi:hypothetical protein
MTFMLAFSSPNGSDRLKALKFVLPSSSMFALTFLLYSGDASSI